MAKGKQKKREEAIDRRGLLDIRKKQDMLAILIRNPEAFAAVSRALEVKHVRAFSEPLAVVWSVAVDYYAEFESAPKRGMLEAEIQNRVAENPALVVGDDERGEIDDFVEMMYDDEQHGANLSKSPEHVRWALKACKLFLEEQVIHDAQELLQTSGSVPKDVPNALQRVVQQIGLAQSVSAQPLKKTFEEGWDNEPSIVVRPTGVDPLDIMLDGGPAGGEVILFMAPYGVCKTTLGTIVTDNNARECVKLEQKSDGKIPVTILVSTEMPIREFRERILVYGGKIPRHRIRAFMEKKIGWDDFCTAPKIGATRETKYEHKFYGHKKGEFEEEFFCERERLRQVIHRANKHILFIDYSSSGGNSSGFGMGGMQELAAVIDAEVRRNPKYKPVNLVIDHIAAMADRMMDSGQYRRDDLTSLLQNMPRQACDYIGKKYDIPILMFHQLSGAANAKRASGAPLSHGEAAGCKSIGMYCDFSIVCGHPTSEPDKLQVAKWELTKHRRTPPKPWLFVGIDGTYHRLTDETDTHTIQGNQIVEASQAIRTRGIDKNLASSYSLEEKKRSRTKVMTEVRG